MVVLIFVLFTILIAFIGFAVYDRISKFFALSFLIYWFFSLLLSCTNLYGMYQVSDETYALLLLNVISFVIGFLCVKIIVKREAISNVNLVKIVNSKFLKVGVFVGIIVVFFLIRVKQTALAYIDNDYALFRKDFFELIFKDKPILLYIYYLYLYPLYYFLSAVIANMLFSYRKWLLIIFFSLYVIPFMTLGEGRSQFLILGLFVLLNYFIYNNGSIKVRHRLKYIVFSIIGVFMLYVMMANTTANRQKLSLKEGMDNLNKSFIIYSVGSFRAFDNAITRSNTQKPIETLYGRASFCGFDYLLSSLMKRVGVEFESSREITNSYFQNTKIRIGRDTMINYSYTNAIYHYYDFGIWGIFFFPFLFGIFCRYIIKKFYSDSSLWLLALLSFIYFISMHTIFSWYFNKLFTVPYIAFLLFMNKRRKKIKSAKHNK